MIIFNNCCKIKLSHVRSLSPVILASHGTGVFIVYPSAVISGNTVLMTRMNSTSKLRWSCSKIVETYAASTVLSINEIIEIGTPGVRDYGFESLECLCEFWSKNHRYLV